jgi:glucose-1-phosphate cytidylyltransferase
VKVIILAGGLGTRISEETSDKPKPMVLIDDKPILWHLMNIFHKQGFSDFIIATGYKKEVIENWISNSRFDWNVHSFDTGLDTQTGGRIKKCMEHLSGERILVTYGDGLGNVNVNELIAFHEANGKLATLTAVHPPARFGYLEIEKGQVTNFGEKLQSASGWINGGFFILEPKVQNYIFGDHEPFEIGALQRLVLEGELSAYQHLGFWQPMDTLREKHNLSSLAVEKIPPWLEV